MYMYVCTVCSYVCMYVHTYVHLLDNLITSASTLQIEMMRLQN